MSLVAYAALLVAIATYVRLKGVGGAALKAQLRSAPQRVAASCSLLHKFLAWAWATYARGSVLSSRTRQRPTVDHFTVAAEKALAALRLPPSLTAAIPTRDEAVAAAAKAPFDPVAQLVDVWGIERSVARELALLIDGIVEAIICRWYRRMPDGEDDSFIDATRRTLNSAIGDVWVRLMSLDFFDFVSREVLHTLKIYLSWFRLMRQRVLARGQAEGKERAISLGLRLVDPLSLAATSQKGSSSLAAARAGVERQRSGSLFGAASLHPAMVHIGGGSTPSGSARDGDPNETPPLALRRVAGRVAGRTHANLVEFINMPVDEMLLSIPALPSLSEALKPSTDRMIAKVAAQAERLAARAGEGRKVAAMPASFDAKFSAAVLGEFWRNDLLHPAAMSDAAEMKYLRRLASAIVGRLLPRSEVQLAALRFLIEELLAVTLLRPLLANLSTASTNRGFIAALRPSGGAGPESSKGGKEGKAKSAKKRNGAAGGEGKEGGAAGGGRRGSEASDADVVHVPLAALRENAARFEAEDERVMRRDRQWSALHALKRMTREGVGGGGVRIDGTSDGDGTGTGTGTPTTSDELEREEEALLRMLKRYDGFEGQLLAKVEAQHTTAAASLGERPPPLVRAASAPSVLPSKPGRSAPTAPPTVLPVAPPAAPAAPPLAGGAASAAAARGRKGSVDDALDVACAAACAAATDADACSLATFTFIFQVATGELDAAAIAAALAPPTATGRTDAAAGPADEGDGASDALLDASSSSASASDATPSHADSRVKRSAQEKSIDLSKRAARRASLVVRDEFVRVNERRCPSPGSDPTEVLYVEYEELRLRVTDAAKDAASAAQRKKKRGARTLGRSSTLNAAAAAAVALPGALNAADESGGRRRKRGKPEKKKGAGGKRRSLGEMVKGRRKRKQELARAKTADAGAAAAASPSASASASTTSTASPSSGAGGRAKLTGARARAPAGGIGGRRGSMQSRVQAAELNTYSLLIEIAELDDAGRIEKRLQHSMLMSFRQAISALFSGPYLEMVSARFDGNEQTGRFDGPGHGKQGEAPLDGETQRRQISSGLGVVRWLRGTLQPDRSDERERAKAEAEAAEARAAETVAAVAQRVATSPRRARAHALEDEEIERDQEDEKQATREAAECEELLKLLSASVPASLYAFLGPFATKQTVNKVHSFVQSEKLVKSLAHTLLLSCLERIFPGIKAEVE